MGQKEIQPGPAKIQYKGFNFLITDRPSNHNVFNYTHELKRHGVAAVVRVCEPSYDTDYLQAMGIAVYDLVYEDGMYPPSYIVEDWFKLLKYLFGKNPEACVAIHCVAGLGRAPVMVALALMELGLKYEEAVEMIRSKKRGAINAKQLRFLEKYRPKGLLRIKRRRHRQTCCIQ